ncbi:Uncharacterised protein [Klebsiella pneumoniae]|nr:Uncharacterised protein [Klebsiella pneumoniae]
MYSFKGAGCPLIGLRFLTYIAVRIIHTVTIPFSKSSLWAFYDAQSLPDYQEEPPNQPKVDLYELDQRDTPDRKRIHNICGGPRHLDHEVS